MWNDTTPLEDHLGVSFKGATYIYPMIQHPLPGIYPREMKISVHESLLLNSNEKIYSSFPHNRQKSGIAQRLITSTMEKVKVKSLSRFWLFVTPWTVAHQAPLSMGFSRQEILEWVAIFFSRGSSRSRDRTQVSCIAGRCFNLWATREAHNGKAVQHLCDEITTHHKGSILLTHTVIGMTLKTVVLRKLKIPTNTQIQYILPSSICMEL